MQTSNDIYIQNREIEQYHFDNCTIETEVDHIDGITTAHCVEHLIDVTSCLGEVEPDLEQLYGGLYAN